MRGEVYPEEMTKTVEIDNKTYWKYQVTPGSDVIHLHRIIDFDEPGLGGDSPGPLWYFTKSKLTRKSHFYFVDKDKVERVPGDYCVIVPPFSCIENILDGRFESQVRIGHAGGKRSKIIPYACLILEAPEGMPESLEDLEEIYLNAKTIIPIERSLNPHILTSKMKELIDSRYNESLQLSELAESLGYSLPQISRQFKKDLTWPPKTYLSRIRVMESTYHLLLDKKITDTSDAVGFQDLSRFNKQFKKITGHQPKQYKSQKTPR